MTHPTPPPLPTPPSRSLFAALTSRPWLLAAVAFVAGALVTSLMWGIGALAAGPAPTVAAPTSAPGRTASVQPTPTSTGSMPSAQLPSSQAASAECPTPTVSVASADALSTALAQAQPGDVISLAPGTYVGKFVATASGTADDPITLCGPQDAVLDGDGVKGGYVFHLDGAQHWHLLGFTVTNGQKGVMADGTTGTTIEGLTVFHIGDEAIHLRKHSTDNRVVGNDISETGLRRDKFGEGVYIGTADSNWCNITDCKPDESNGNIIEGNYIHGTSSEAVDIKEGTRDGILRGNTFDGSSIVGADSWVDVKGNNWLIEGNTGTNSPLDGFQTHEIGNEGYGSNNTFRGNKATVNGPGFGFSFTPVNDNVVTCDNVVESAAEGYANVDCS
ncbi:right-handed parallel beta-helix repeat-containing protein [Microbacterium telephonicum]|uniref:Nitrous oxidase accessory protein NosD n=1 Tax=Microbacterium telephonicum TaxID=1714841 RepID=A0A498BYV7_9MICO|nr:right-handed parallel beta-helix repeat-containing protein [Microbacterium telephonicum]RLK47989.1 nitrous oxidase accessory protein NosD [Microbacterium telephonicum]